MAPRRSSATASTTPSASRAPRGRPARKPLVVLGLVGTNLDAGRGADRWGRWRPTVSIVQHEDFVVDRLELIHDTRTTALGERVEADVHAVSPETEVVRHVRDFADPWDFEEVYGVLHDFATSRDFDPEREDYLVHITTGTHVVQICLFLLTEARYFPARLLQTGPPPRGRRDARRAIIDLDLSRYDRLAARFEREHDDAIASLKGGIATRSDRFNRLIERIEHVAARTTDPMLITGPTGAGKSRLASRIHQLRRHRRLLDGPLVEVNCATLRGEGAMSALFGHRRGAFTGAATERAGLLRSAHGGMLFLDEIGELGLDEQAMLLRAIETGRFMPMGADAEVESDFQLIAGTNRDLVEQVAAGRFRDDLLARIDLWTFELPGLAERREDIEPNVDHELERFARERGRQVRFSREARRRYLDFAVSPAATWPGNFRDLGSSLLRMATLAPGGRITEEVVAEEIALLRRAWRRSGAGAVGRIGAGDATLAELLGDEAPDEIDLFDRVQLAAVVDVCRRSSSLSDAGRTLFAASRSRRTSVNDADRLRKYLARFELDWKRVRRPAADRGWRDGRPA